MGPSSIPQFLADAAHSQGILVIQPVSRLLSTEVCSRGASLPPRRPSCLYTCCMETSLCYHLLHKTFLRHRDARKGGEWFHQLSEEMKEETEFPPTGIHSHSTNTNAYLPQAELSARSHWEHISGAVVTKPVSLHGALSVLTKASTQALSFLFLYVFWFSLGLITFPPIHLVFYVPTIKFMLRLRQSTTSMRHIHMHEAWTLHDCHPLLGPSAQAALRACLGDFPSPSPGPMFSCLLA